MSNDEAALIEKLRKIEALHAGATTVGERVAASEARKRIVARIEAMRATDPPVERKFTIADPWARRVFNALARRYGLLPYRHAGQHRQTIMLRVGLRFLDQTRWPEFMAIHDELHTYLHQVTERVIRETLDASSGEAEEVPAGALGPGGEKK
jgi:hypothetical protein